MHYIFLSSFFCYILLLSLFYVSEGISIRDCYRWCTFVESSVTFYLFIHHFLSHFLSLSLSISFTFSLSLLFHIKYSSPVWCFFLLSSFRWIFSFPMLSRPPLLSCNLYFLLHLSLPHCLWLLSVSCSYLFPLYLPEAIIYFLSFYLAAQYMLVSLPVLHF